MQSVMTVFLASLVAFMGVYMMPADPNESVQLVEVEPEADAILVSTTLPSFLIEPWEPLVLAPEYSRSLRAAMDLPMEGMAAFSQ